MIPFVISLAAFLIHPAYFLFGLITHELIQAFDPIFRLLCWIGVGLGGLSILWGLIQLFAVYLAGREIEWQYTFLGILWGIAAILLGGVVLEFHILVPVTASSTAAFFWIYLASLLALSGLNGLATFIVLTRS